jgi:tRNA(Ile)-lysidine synthase
MEQFMPPYEKSIRKILDYIREFNLIKSGERIIVALSGGPDSIFLLHALVILKNILNIEIYALHVHHGARGELADSDAEFCRETCESLGIEYLEIRKDVPSYAKEHGMSFEEAGRVIRLDAFREASCHFNADKTATGHNANDQAETVLMRIITGTGPTGLSGIRPVLDNFVIRPLLTVTRNEIQDFLNRNNISYRIDHTNKDTSFLRNRIRHLLIPFIKKNFNENIEDTLIRTASIFKSENDFMNETIEPYLRQYVTEDEKGVHICADELSELSPYVLSMIMLESVKMIHGSLKGIGFNHAENLRKLVHGKTGDSFQLPGGLVAEKTYDKILIRKTGSEELISLPEIKVHLPGEHVLPEWNLVVYGEITRQKPVEYTLPFTAYLDADKTGEGEFTIRSRKSGDRFHPLGSTGAKKLKDFFIDEKIPLRERDQILLLEKDGVIVWIAGIRPSELYKIDENTERVLMVKIEHFEDDRHV